MDRLHNALSRICIWRKRGLLGGFRFWSAVLTHDPSPTKCWWGLTAPVAIDANAPHKFEVRAVFANVHDVVLGRYYPMKRHIVSGRREAPADEYEWKAHRSKQKTQNRNLSPSFWPSCAFSVGHVRIRPQRDHIARKHQRGTRRGNAVLSGSDTACAHLDGSRRRNSGVQACRCCR